MKYLWVRAESAHWCGYGEHRKVLVEDHVEATEASLNLSGIEDMMRDYIGEADDDEAEEWEYDDYSAVIFFVDEWDEKKHFSPDLYQVLEGYKK